jgi:hypothetical protein
LDDYRAPFDPTFELGRLSRPALAILAREYQLAAHLQDRAGIPQVLARHGADAMQAIAIDEWLAASPVYTRRMQRALGFTGDDVATIFKGMQLDVGAPHGFLDFRFRVDDARSGEFWLPYCGALADVEPMGEKLVVSMCHHIEDPTFDGTAGTTNPRAQIRPLHRPPRVPADRVPNCHWQVRIEPDATPFTEIGLTERLRGSRVAQLPASTPTGRADGLLDYSGAFDPDLELEDFAQPTLRTICDEFCTQGHLLVRTFMMAIADRWGDEAAREIAAHQWVGIAGVAAERVAAAMRIAGDDLEAIAKLFQLHPSFHPRAYVDLHVERTADRVLCWIGDCAALAEGDPYSWFALLGPTPHRALEAMACAVNPRARCEPASVPGGRVAWSVGIDPDAPPAPEPPEVALTKMSKGATFRWVSRRRADRSPQAS